MGTFRIIYALSTMFSLAYCYEYSFALDVPAILNSFSNMATQALSSSQYMSSSRTAQHEPYAESDAEGPSLAAKLQKVTSDVVGYMANMLNTISRRMADMKPNVEMGPGSFKSEQVTYPPHYFVDRLKTLLKIKKKEEDRQKPLNKAE